MTLKRVASIAIKTGVGVLVGWFTLLCLHANKLADGAVRIANVRVVQCPGDRADLVEIYVLISTIEFASPFDRWFLEDLPNSVLVNHPSYAIERVLRAAAIPVSTAPGEWGNTGKDVPEALKQLLSELSWSGSGSYDLKGQYRRKANTAQKEVGSFKVPIRLQPRPDFAAYVFHLSGLGVIVSVAAAGLIILSWIGFRISVKSAPGVSLVVGRLATRASDATLHAASTLKGRGAATIRWIESDETKAPTRSSPLDGVHAAARAIEQPEPSQSVGKAVTPSAKESAASEDTSHL
jgi:hypothetical protein